MSLLMQALKKAEHAKKQAAGETGPVPALSDAGLSLQDKDQDQDQRTERTGAMQLEMQTATPSVDFSEPQAVAAPIIQPVAAPAPAPAPASIPQLQPAHAAAPAPVADQPRSEPATDQPAQKPPRLLIGPTLQAQLHAQSMLNAKQPTRSGSTFIIAASSVLLTLLGCAAAFYYWQSSAPNPGMDAMNYRAPQQAGTIAPVTQEASAVAPAASAAASPSSAASASPSALATAPLATAPAPAPKPATPHHQTQPDLGEPKAHTVQLKPPTAQQAEAQQIQINKSQQPTRIHVTLTDAYHLFTAGNISAARPLYQSVLNEEPNNRDALLGMAAIALNQYQPEQAAVIYSHLIDLDPTDADAIAGLTSLKKSSPDQSESQLKQVLARNPQSGATLFQLGNLYAQQSRWNEAQEAYFSAFGTTPQNADYAFNLAVSLDRLEQNKLALDYYQRALALAKSAPGNFSQDAAASRIAQLQQSVNR